MKRDVIIFIVIVLLALVVFFIFNEIQYDESQAELGSLRSEIREFFGILFGMEDEIEDSDLLVVEAVNNEIIVEDNSDVDEEALEVPAQDNVVAVGNPELRIGNWEFIGPGGGGRFEGPAISPHDPNFLLTSGDTGLNYKSLDNGETWEVMNLFYKSGKYSRYRTAFEFHPEDEDLIFFADREGFYKSNDKGESWEVIEGPWDDVRYVHPNPKMSWRATQFGPQVVEFSRYDADFGLAAFDEYQQFDNLKLFITEDGGSRWRELSWSPENPSEKIKGIVFDQVNKNRVFIATDKNFYITWNKGRNIWVREKTALDDFTRERITMGDFVSFGGVSRRGKRNACDHTTLLVADSNNQIYNWNTCFGEFQRVAESDIWPTRSFRNASGDLIILKMRINQIEVSHWNPAIAYASVSGVQPWNELEAPGLGGLFKTEDGGITWAQTLYRNPLMEDFNFDPTWRTSENVWGSHLEARGVAIDERNANHVFISDSVSNDRGASWKRIDSDSDDQNKALAGEGMPIMRAWDFLVDGQNQYIAMTDFATWTSADDGETWKFHSRSVDNRPLAKNIYKNVKVGNKVIGFGSEIHDLPAWNYLASNKEGKEELGTGVMQISEDNGNSWEVFAPNARGLPTVSDKGLPSNPFTDALVLEDGSILVAVLGKFGGIYRSDDQGDSFYPYNEGISGFDHNDLSVDREQEEYNEDTGELTNIYGNRYAHKLGRTSQGKVYAVFTARVQKPGYFPGQVYFLNRDVWEPVLDSQALQNNIAYPVDFKVNPNNQNDMLITTYTTVNEPVVEGGLWRSTNAGRNWAKIYDGADVYSALFDNGRIFISTEDEGLQYTDDNGGTWNRVDNLRVSRPSRLIADGDQLIVGSQAQGLWKSY